MSIIQEALKKSQGTSFEAKQPLLKKAKPKIKQVRMPMFRKIDIMPKRLSAFSLAGIIAIFILSSFTVVNHFVLKRTQPHKLVIAAKNAPRPVIGDVEPAIKEVGPKIEIENVQHDMKRTFSNITINKPPKFILNGIMHLPGEPKAIINSMVVREGDNIEGAVVKVISDDSVLLIYNSKEIAIRMQ